MAQDRQLEVPQGAAGVDAEFLLEVPAGLVSAASASACRSHRYRASASSRQARSRSGWASTKAVEVGRHPPRVARVEAGLGEVLDGVEALLLQPCGLGLRPRCVPDVGQGVAAPQRQGGLEVRDCLDRFSVGVAARPRVVASVKSRTSTSRALVSSR